MKINRLLPRKMVKPGRGNNKRPGLILQELGFSGQSYFSVEKYILNRRLGQHSLPLCHSKLREWLGV